ncbi:MAG: C25 family cysteine peptidase [Anaerolineae bacterium]
MGFTLFGFVLSSVGGEASASPPMFDPRPIAITTVDGLILDWHAPLAQVVPQPDGTFQIMAPGYAQADQPGQPQLPIASVLIALPSDANPTLQVLQTEEAVQPLPGRLAIAPRPEGVTRDPAGIPLGGAYAPAADMPLVQHDRIEIEIIGIVRGVRLARLTFYPARPIGQTLHVTTRLRVSLAFNSVLRSSYSVTTAFHDPLLASLRSAVINPADVNPGPQSAISDTRYATRNTQHATSRPPYAVEIASPGPTALTYEALAAAGFPVGSADPQYVHLTRSGSEIAAEWDGDGDAAFEAGERLLFYADPRFSRYTSTDVYFLSIETTSGLRMSSRSAAPASYPAGSAWIDATAETNARYTPDCFCGLIPSGRDGDRWTWDTLRRPDRASLAYPIDLPAVDATQPATLTLWLIGYTDVAANPDHRVDVSLNSSPPGRVEWNGKQAITASLPITPGILRSGTNSVTLTLPGLPGVGVEGMWLDAFSIRTARGTAPTGSAAAFRGESTRRAYSITLTSTVGLRAYDVTDPDRPLRLTNLSLNGNTISLSDPALGRPRRYALASDIGILSPTNLRPTSPLQTSSVSGADYVVISPIDFVPALTGLIALRESQGLTVTVESAQAIYDAYGGGRPDPAALRAYLANAYATWALRPTYVLLVGDGTFDPKGYRADTPPTIIPPYLADVDPWAGETAADNRYVTVDGADNLPDMLIGRLPVNTLAETQIVVNKIVQYETQPAPGGWNGNVVFAADNPDSAGDFPAQSEIIASTFISAPFRTQRMYYMPPTTTLTTTRQAVLNQWNAGAGLVMYIGHASVHQWLTERLFHLDDVPGLSNGSRLPVVLEMTCFTGSFQNPSFATLDESLMRKSGGGAVAVWGATGLGVSTGHDDLAAGFMQSVFIDGQTNLGLSTLSGKLSLVANNPAHLDLVDTFTLLGDPATRINLTLVPWPHSIYLPSIQR